MTIEDQIIIILKHQPTSTKTLRQRIKAQPDDVGHAIAQLANDGRIEQVGHAWRSWSVWRLTNDRP